MTFETHFTSSRRRIALVLVAAGVTFAASSTAYAERACLADPLITLRTCPAVVCLALQENVNNFCKNQQIFSCRRLKTCEALKEMRRRWIDCGEARNTINAPCWRGGDADHQNKANEAWQNVGECNKRIAEFCDDPCSDIFKAPSALYDATIPAATEGATIKLMIPILENLTAEGMLDLLVGESVDTMIGEPDNADGGEPEGEKDWGSETKGDTDAPSRR